MAKLFNPEDIQGGNGIFVTQVKITDVRVNDAPSQFSKEIDYIFDIENEYDGQTYKNSMFVSGNNLKAAGDVSLPEYLSNLLKACGIMTQPNMNSIVDAFSSCSQNPVLVSFFVGKEIKILKYVSGTYPSKDGGEKPNYKIWNAIQGGFGKKINPYDIKTPNNQIIEAFLAQVKNKKSKIKYTPEVLEETETSNGSDSREDTEEDNY